MKGALALPANPLDALVRANRTRGARLAPIRSLDFGSWGALQSGRGAVSSPDMRRRMTHVSPWAMRSGRDLRGRRLDAIAACSSNRVFWKTGFHAMFIQVENSRCIGAASEDGMDCERPPDQEEGALRFGRGAVPSPARGRRKTRVSRRAMPSPRKRGDFPQPPNRRRARPLRPNFHARKSLGDTLKKLETDLEMASRAQNPRSRTPRPSPPMSGSLFHATRPDVTAPRPLRPNLPPAESKMAPEPPEKAQNGLGNGNGSWKEIELLEAL